MASTETAEAAGTDPGAGGGQRPPWVVPVLVALVAVVVIVVVVAIVSSDDDDSSTEVETDAGTAIETELISAQVVSSLQQELTELGYYSGPIDGEYGQATTDAVEALQSDLGVPVDGRYGPATHEALVAALDAAESQTVSEIQTLLTQLGYYSGPIDGVYGAATVEAVMALQTDLGVTADGILGPETIAALEAAQRDGDTSAAASGPTVALSISSGLSETLEVTRCDNPGETTITLEAQTDDLEEPLMMSLDAQGGTGTIVLSGADEAEGTVDEIMVGDTGEITASGMITVADDSATTTDTWQLSGNCA